MTHPNKIIFQTDSSAIEFSRFETSGQNNFCGYNAISNYIKFLPLQQRLDCYKKLLSKAWDRHNQGSEGNNLFKELTEELKVKLLFLEEFFKLRELNSYQNENEFIEGETLFQENFKKKIALNLQSDQQYFKQAKEKFIQKYPFFSSHPQAIQALDYDQFFKEFYLEGGVLRGSLEGGYQVLFDETYDQSYSSGANHDEKIFSYQYNFLKTSYQNWVSFLMAIAYNAGSFIEILDAKKIFDDLLPHNSYIILGAGVQLGSGVATLDQKHYTIKNKYLESVYKYCEQHEILHRREASASHQFNFKHQFGLEDYKNILVSAYLQILKKFESASHQLVDGSGIEHDQQQSMFKIFRHFLLKQNYDDFFDENKDHMQEACDQLFTHFFDVEGYRGTLFPGPEISTQDVLAIIKSNDFTSIIDGDHQREELTQLNQKYKQIKKIFKIVLKYFKQENSFERQYFHAINSDPLIVANPRGIHFTSYIASAKVADQFPAHETFQSLYLQSLSTRNFQEEVAQSLNFFIDKEAQKLEQDNLPESRGFSPSLPLVPSSSPLPSPSPSINITQQTSSLFDKLKGRNDDNFRYRVSANESNEPIHARISKAIKNFNPKEGGLNDNGILLAMLLAKNFGGIGTKIDSIFSSPNPNQTPLDPERQALVDLLKHNTNLFNLLKKFSANFQIQCKELGVYSGNKEIKDDVFLDKKSIEKKHGLRLAFIPDEFVLEYINKTSIRDDLKNIAKNLIAKKIKNYKSLRVLDNSTVVAR